LVDLQRLTCFDRSHAHISRSQLYDYEKHSSIEWIAIKYKDGGFTPTEHPALAEKWFGGIVRISRLFQFRGASSALGEYLSACLRRREPWAEVMLHDMRGHREREDESQVVRELLQM
jgi:hypothetical protein